MIARFALYGFLKNQQYYEPFFMLALLEKGVSFTIIGLLVSVREITVNLLEVPSGYMADRWGRRRCMSLSMAAYIVSFLLLYACLDAWGLAVAMVLFGTGEAFRSGTHKAMIMHWAELNGRKSELTRIYGYTRSWSKIGSAVSAVAAGLIVSFSGTYSSVFLYSIPPYLLCLANVATYPPSLEAGSGGKESESADSAAAGAAGSPGASAPQGFLRSLMEGPLPRLLLASILFEGAYKSTKDYVQPFVKGMFGDISSTAFVVSGYYLVLALVATVSSRHAHRIEKSCGGRDSAGRLLWILAVVLYGALSLSLSLELGWAVLLAFLALASLQNLWRPLQIARISETAPSERLATVLSIDSQGRSAASFVLSPLAGWLVDSRGMAAAALCGLVCALTGALLDRLRASSRCGMPGSSRSGRATCPSRRERS